MSYRSNQNDNKYHSGTSGGIGFCGLLTIVFIDKWNEWYSRKVA